MWRGTVIAVRENRNRMKNELESLGFAAGKLFIAENYPEAVGIMTALRKGGSVVVCEVAFGRDYA